MHPFSSDMLEGPISPSSGIKMSSSIGRQSIPSGNDSQFAIENGHRNSEFSDGKIVIFHSDVSLPESSDCNWIKFPCFRAKTWTTAGVRKEVYFDGIHASTREATNVCAVGGFKTSDIRGSQS